MMRTERYVARSLLGHGPLAWSQSHCRSSLWSAASLLGDASTEYRDREDMHPSAQNDVDGTISSRIYSSCAAETSSGKVPSEGGAQEGVFSRLWKESTNGVSHCIVSRITGGILGIDRPTLLMAAPKKKTSPSRKGMRSASKFVEFIPVVSQCSKCARVFPPHTMPSKCEEHECPAFPNGSANRTGAGRDH